MVFHARLGRRHRETRQAFRSSRPGELAIAEAHQGFPGKLQTLTIASYRVDHEAMLDLFSEIACNAAGVSFVKLGCARERIASEGHDPPTWLLTHRLTAEGIGGIIVPSFAVSAPLVSVNLVVWHGSPSSPNRVQVIEDNERLPKTTYQRIKLAEPSYNVAIQHQHLGSPQDAEFPKVSD